MSLAYTVTGELKRLHRAFKNGPGSPPAPILEYFRNPTELPDGLHDYKPKASNRHSFGFGGMHRTKTSRARGPIVLKRP